MKNIVIYIAIVIIWNPATVNSQEKITVANLKADLFLVKKALEEAHPGLYRYNNKKYIDSLFTNAEKAIQADMIQQDFYRLLVPVITQIGCGHTKLHPDNNWNNNYFYGRDHLFPLRIHLIENRAYILGSYQTEIIPRGSEIITINGQPVTDIVATMLTGAFSDGRNTTFKYLELSRFFSAFYANLIDAPDSFRVEYMHNMQIKDTIIQPIRFDIIERYNKENAPDSKEPYWYACLDDQTALLTISSFWQKGNTKYPRFLKKAFREFNQKNITKLIIDLRNNEGGKDKRGALLMSYLANKEFRYYDRLIATSNKKFSFSENAHFPKFYGIFRLFLSKTDSGTFVWKHNRNLAMQQPVKNPFSGDVIILINGASFSVTAEFASAMKYQRRAIFVGEETGGTFYGNNSGSFVIVTLPHSRLIIGIPLLAYYMAVKNYPYYDRGIIPDFIVVQEIDDILNNYDRVLECALKLTYR